MRQPTRFGHKVAATIKVPFFKINTHTPTFKKTIQKISNSYIYEYKYILVHTNRQIWIWFIKLEVYTHIHTYKQYKTKGSSQFNYPADGRTAQASDVNAKSQRRQLR